MSSPVAMEIATSPLAILPAAATPNTISPYSSRHEKSGDRPIWSSRSTYACALLSVLLSQFWRGTAMVARTNVWASLLALVMSFGVIGLPLLLLERGLAQSYQVGAVGIWQLPHLLSGRRRPGPWTGLGVASLWVGLITASLSAGILAWTLHAWVDSFYVQETVVTREYWIETIVGQEQVLDSSTDVASLSIQLEWENAGYLLLIWIIVGTVSSLGARHMGRILLVVTSGSLTLLLILAIASLFVKENNNNHTTPSEETDMWTDFQAAIDQGDVLSEAIIQTLYMTGLFVGIQSAYASYGPARGEPNARIATATVGIHMLVLILTGYCVSVALQRTGQNYNWHPLQNEVWASTISILWVQWPAALSTLSIHWVRLLYTVLLTLGLQLPIAVVTAFLAVVKDDRTFGISRWRIAALISALGFLVSLPFATSAGLVFMDTTDYYLTLTVLLIGFLHSFALGWMYNLEEQIHHFGRLPLLFYVLWNFVPVLVAAAVWFGYDNSPSYGSSSSAISTIEVDASHYQRMWIGLFGGIAVFLLLFAICFVAIRRSYDAYIQRVQQRGTVDNSEPPMLHPRDYYLEFCFGNVEALKRNIQPSLGQKLPQVWYIFLKRVIPHLLLLVFCKRLLMVRGGGGFAFGQYGGYPLQPYQLMGLVFFGLVVGMFLLGLVYPAVYAPIVPPPTSIFINRRDTMEEEDVEEGTGDESQSSSNSEAVIEALPGMEDPEEIMNSMEEEDVEEGTGTGDESQSSSNSEAVIEALPDTKDPEEITDDIQRVEDVEEGTEDESKSSNSETVIEALPDMEDPEEIVDDVQRVEME